VIDTNGLEEIDKSCSNLVRTFDLLKKFFSNDDIDLEGIKKIFSKT